MTNQQDSPVAAPALGVPLTREDLSRGFRGLGLEAGSTVLVQSSYKAFGGVAGGPKTVIEAILNVLTPDGTLVMPHFNFEDFGQKKLYSKRSTKSQAGILSEMLSRWDGVRRIYHPFHGFALVGRLAGELAEKVKNETSFESSSLFGELQRRNGQIMLLGVNYSHGLSFIHYVEESVGVPYREFIVLKGRVEELDGRVHDIAMRYYGTKERNMDYHVNNVAPHLEEGGKPVVSVGKVGLSTVKVMRAGAVYDVLAAAFRKNPNLIV